MVPYRVLVGAGYWSLSGVHVFAVHLVRGLRARGVDAQLFLTEQNTELVSLPPNMMTIPRDIPVRELPVARKGTWADHWHTTICFVEENAPCIYMPNVDYRHSCVCPKLSRNVGVVGVIQSDDPVHYEHVQRLGRYWDAIVGVSDECARKAASVDPTYDSRTYAIPNGAPVPDKCPSRAFEPGAPLSFVYHGVLNTHQKRILDMPLILRGLTQRGVPFRFTVAGSGPQQQELLDQCKPWLENGQMRFLGQVPNERIASLLAENDAYVLTSAFEGLPHAVVEAMAAGCVPVVTDVESGVPDLVANGRQGYRIPIGDVEEFATKLEYLQKNPEERRAMSLAAHERVLHSPYNVKNMVESYMKVFERVWRDAQGGVYRRPKGPVLPPPATVAGLSIFPVEHAEFVAQVERLLPN